MGMFAVVDLASIDVQLDRTADTDGSRQFGIYPFNPGRYPGYDRFGRVVRQAWVDGDYTVNPPGTNPTRPEVAAFAYTYDKDSNRTARYETTPSLAWPLDEQLTYDHLDRLTGATVGTWDGTAFTQLLEEYIDDDAPLAADFDDASDIDRHVQYVWGARYIDDLVLRREDRGGTPGYDDLQDIYRYYLTDVQFSPVAILDGAADLVERVSYTPYGEARHHRRADLDGEGDTDAADDLPLQQNLGSFGAGDLNRNGVVDSTDQAIASADAGPALPAGELSDPGEGNVIGYDGYVFNAETADYTVRFRCYTSLGRWLERDPLRFVDGLALYEYVLLSAGRRGHLGGFRVRVPSTDGPHLLRMRRIDSSSHCCKYSSKRW